MSSGKVKADLRPTDHEYALLSNHVYKKDRERPIKNTPFETKYRKWLVSHTKESESGYFGLVYRCDITKQFVVTHKGTSCVRDFYEDFRGVFLNKESVQKRDSKELVKWTIHHIRALFPDYKLSFTGQSLGAFLAELSVYYAVEYFQFPHVNAVTFESPGSKQSIMNLQKSGKKYTTSQPLTCEQIEKLDIVTYLCYPNIVNSCNEHVGTVYWIDPDLAWGNLGPCLLFRLFSSHKMQDIVGWFEEVHINENANYTRKYMANWPYGIKQMRIFFKLAMRQNKMLTLDSELIKAEIPTLSIPPQKNDQRGKDDELSSSTSSLFSSIISRHTGCLHKDPQCENCEKWVKEQGDKIKLQCHGNFRVVENQSTTFQSLPLHHFCPSFQDFLQVFFEKLHSACDGSSNGIHHSLKEKFANRWKAFVMPEDVSRNLLTYSIRVNSLDIKEIVCVSPQSQSAHNFRRIVSCWLEKSGFTAEDLINDSILKEIAAMNNLRKHFSRSPIPTYIPISKQNEENHNSNQLTILQILSLAS